MCLDLYAMQISWCVSVEPHGISSGITLYMTIWIHGLCRQRTDETDIETSSYFMSLTKEGVTGTNTSCISWYGWADEMASTT